MLKRKSVFWSALVLYTTLGMSFSASSGDKSNKQTVIESGGFLHSVYFWLKNPDSKADRETFEKHLNTFINSSQYVKSKFVGKVAPSDREVVDSSYTYTLVLSFASKEDQDKYQIEPVHLKFVNDAQHLWEKVVVYDSFNTL